MIYPSHKVVWSTKIYIPEKRQWFSFIRKASSQKFAILVYTTWIFGRVAFFAKSYKFLGWCKTKHYDFYNWIPFSFSKCTLVFYMNSDIATIIFIRIPSVPPRVVVSYTVIVNKIIVFVFAERSAAVWIFYYYNL